MSFEMYVPVVGTDELSDDFRRRLNALEDSMPFNSSALYDLGSDGWLRVMLSKLLVRMIGSSTGIDASNIDLQRSSAGSPNISVVISSDDCNALTSSMTAINRMTDLSEEMNTCAAGALNPSHALATS